MPKIGGGPARSTATFSTASKPGQKVARKLGDLQRQEFDWSRDVAKIGAATMLVFADADTYRLEHITELYKLLGGGQRDAGLDGSLRSPNRLAIVPGTTHYDILATTTVAGMVDQFLGAAK